MNKKVVGISAIVLGVLILGISTVSAAWFGRGGGDETRPERPALNDEQKVEMETRMAEREINQAEMQTALVGGDYDSWKTLVEEKQAKHVNVLDVITNDNFDKFVEMHNLKQAGDMEGAQAIAEELGLPAERGMGMMKMHRQGRRGGHGGGQFQPES